MPTSDFTCALCASSSRSPLYTRDDLSYVICDDCTFVYIYPRPTEREYQKFYDEDYQRHRHNVVDYDQAVARLLKKGSYEKKQVYLQDFDKYITKESRVFEVGAGWGTLLRLIQDVHGCYVEGVEIGEIQSQVAANHYGLNVHHNTFEDFAKKYNGKQFDFVIMAQVLEHLVDLDGAIRDLKKLLHKDGILYLAVPNIAHPFEPLDRFFHFEHVYYFSPYTLSELLKKHGLKIVWMKKKAIDIRVLITHEESNLGHLITSDLKTKYRRERIKRILVWQHRKYELLRILKKTANIFLPSKVFLITRRWMVALFKKIRVIDV